MKRAAIHPAATHLLGQYESFLRVERQRGALTIRRYRAILEEFLGSLPGPPTAFSRQDAISFLRSAGHSQEPSRSVWNLRLAALRSLVSYLVHTEVIVQDPTLGLERHKIESREPVPLSLDEFGTVVEAARATRRFVRARNVAIVQTLFNTLLRVHELVSLDVDQIEWEAYVFRDVRTKGAKWLTASFNDLVAAELQTYLRARGAERQVTSGALFASTRGTRLSVRAVERLVSDLGKAAGIARPVTPHLFRHSGATQLAELGTDIKVVQRICGHACQSTTQTYIHPRDGASHAAIHALGSRVARHLRNRSRARGKSVA